MVIKIWVVTKLKILVHSFPRETIGKSHFKNDVIAKFYLDKFSILALFKKVSHIHAHSSIAPLHWILNLIQSPRSNLNYKELKFLCNRTIFSWNTSFHQSTWHGFIWCMGKYYSIQDTHIWWCLWNIILYNII